MAETIEVILRLAIDQQQTEQQVSRVVERAKDTTQRTLSTMQMGIGGFVLALYGRQIEMLGKKLLDPLRQMQRADIIPTRATVEWADAMERVHRSAAMVGVEMAEVLLPALKEAARTSESFVKFLDANPAVTKAIVGAGGTLLAFGWIVSLLGNILSVLSALKMLGVLQGIGSLTGILGPAALFTTAAAGGASGRGLGNILGRAIYGEQWQAQGWRDIALTAMRIQALPMAGVGQIAQAIPGLESFGAHLLRGAAAMDSFIQKLLGFQEVGGAGGELFVPRSAVDAYIDYLRDIEDLQAETERKRAEIIAESGERILDIEQRASEQRNNLLADYKEQEKNALDDYMRQREKLIRDAEEDILQLEERFQLRMRWMQEDHHNRLDDLARRRDALGIVKEIRRYNQERRREEEEHDLEIEHRRRDLALRLRDLAEASRREKAIRDKDIAQRMKDIEEWRQKEIAEEAAAREKKLRRLEESHRLEESRIQQHFYDTLRMINENLLGERGLRAQYYALMEADLLRHLNTMRSIYQSLPTGFPNYPGTQSETLPAGPYQPYQSGGYTAGGLALLHGGEFVLSADTVRAAERLAGARLSQEGILRAMRGITLHQNIRFDGRISAQDRHEIARIARTAAIEGVAVAVGRG